MLYWVLILTSLFSVHAKTGEIEDYSFMDGNWSCNIKMEISNNAILEVDTLTTTSIKNLESTSKSKFKLYYKHNSNVVSIIFVESSEKFDFNGNIMRSYGSKTHQTTLVKDDLNILTPEFVQGFTRGPEAPEVKSKVSKIDNDNIALTALASKDVIHCSRVKNI
ncbi:hypothetical protein [Pseudoalteromonas sp. ZZD1]|uniref:hypothetical protein n=1 Tax=Pseudoalteromonas sp. ZZD1 TaxID=3139395 RepID=UPI003BAD7B9B